MESFSVKAVLSALDKGFTSTIKSSVSSLNGIKNVASSATSSIMKIASGIGVFKAVSAIGNGITGLIGDMGEASAAWKTFEGNMTMNGTAASEIQDIKKELQDFATQTVYSASDMASTYAQLAAVGTQNTKKLVKGFGGLAAAAENPQQAMKTLSQQATQMAAKPTVAWEDFKLMLEQTPAGVAAVAKTMGMSTTDMIKNIQAGTLATEDFFNAVAETGTNANFTKLATEYKTVGQAMDGLTETMGTKLQPAFDTLSSYGIKAVSKLADSFDQIDGNAIAEKLSSGIDTIMKYVDAFKTNMSGVGSAFKDAFSAIGAEFSDLTGKFGSDTSIQSFGDAVHVAAEYLKAFAGFLKDNADKIAAVLKNLPKLLIAYQGFKILRAIAPLVGAFTGAIGGLAKLGLSKIAPKLFGVAKGQDAVGKSSSGSSKKMLASAKSFMMVGAGVAIIAGGFYLLASAAVKLSDSGGLAIGIMAVMTGAVLALSFGMMSLLKNVKTTPARLNAVSNAFLKMSAGIALVVGSLAVLALALVPLASLGTTAVPPLLAFGVVVGGLAAILGAVGKKLQASAVGVAVFAATVSVMALAMTPIAQTGLEGAAAMGAFGLVVAGLVAVFGLLGSALNVAIPGMIAFGLTIVAVGAGMALAEGFIRSLPPVIQQLGETFTQVAASIADAVSQIVSVIGDTLCNVMTTAGDAISQVVDSINEGFETIADGITSVIDAISGGFSSVLDSIAGVIESVGTSARNAGEGFKAVAVGIGMIADLSLFDIAKSLGAVAVGIGEISTAGSGLPEVADGMLLIVTSLTAATTGMMAFYNSAIMVSTVATTLKTAVDNIKAAFEGFVINPPDMSSVTAAFMQVTSAARETVPALVQAGTQGGTGFSSGLLNGCNMAQNAMNGTVKSIIATAQTIVPRLTSTAQNAMNSFNGGLSAGFKNAESIVQSGAMSIVSAMDGVPDRMYSCGYYIGMGLANGMRSTLGEVRSVASQLAAAAEEAVIAKSKIGSPSKVFIKLGEYIGEGFAIGIESMGNLVERVSENMVSIPSTPSFAGVPSGNISRNDLSSEYSYNPVVYVSTEVKSIMDGKEVGRGSAPYVKAENDRITKVKQKINGIR